MRQPAEIFCGDFALYPNERLFLKNGVPILLRSRALDILLVLVRRAGDLVTKQELIEAVWPGVVVEEVSLRVHISTLRKALGGGPSATSIIRNVSGRGYCFTAPITNGRESPRSDTRFDKAANPHTGVRPSSKIVGREDSIDLIVGKLQSHRFLTITGAGGVEKTTVALATADRLSAMFSDGIYFIDLGSLTSGQRIACALTSTLGLMSSADPIGMVLAFLRNRRTLLILDNCEHLLEMIAPIAESIIHGTPGAHILATSRERLRARGEHVYRLPALAVP